jgi:hypothetical protein
MALEHPALPIVQSLPVVLVGPIHALLVEDGFTDRVELLSAQNAQPEAVEEGAE